MCEHVEISTMGKQNCSHKMQNSQTKIEIEIWQGDIESHKYVVPTQLFAILATPCVKTARFRRKTSKFALNLNY